MHSKAAVVLQQKAATEQNVEGHLLSPQAVGDQVPLSIPNNKIIILFLTQVVIPLKVTLI
jgi:hypothetical protein